MESTPSKSHSPSHQLAVQCVCMGSTFLVCRGFPISCFFHMCVFYFPTIQKYRYKKDCLLKANWLWNLFSTPIFLHFAEVCPPYSQNISRNLLVSVEQGGGTAIGTVLRFSCSGNYHIHGEYTVTCVSPGVWSGLFPYCVPGENG